MTYLEIVPPTLWGTIREYVLKVLSWSGILPLWVWPPFLLTISISYMLRAHLRRTMKKIVVQLTGSMMDMIEVIMLWLSRHLRWIKWIVILWLSSLLPIWSENASGQEWMWWLLGAPLFLALLGWMAYQIQEQSKTSSTATPRNWRKMAPSWKVVKWTMVGLAVTGVLSLSYYWIEWKELAQQACSYFSVPMPEGSDLTATCLRGIETASTVVGGYPTLFAIANAGIGFLLLSFGRWRIGLILLVLGVGTFGYVHRESLQRVATAVFAGQPAQAPEPVGTRPQQTTIWFQDGGTFRVTGRDWVTIRYPDGREMCYEYFVLQGSNDSLERERLSSGRRYRLKEGVSEEVLLSMKSYLLPCR